MPPTRNQPSSTRSLRSEILLQARFIRRAVRRANQSLRFGNTNLNTAPILFANSFPKSGTHLLTQVLKGFVKLGPAVDSGLPAIAIFEGHTGLQRSEDEIIRDLERLLPGDIAFGHIHASPKVISMVCRDGVVAYFIMRDPRDVVISHAHYVTDMEPNHIHHRYYQETLANFNEQLTASIAGVGDDKPSGTDEASTNSTLPNILERFKPYMEWLEHSEVLVLRFEDFVNHRKTTIEQVLVHAVKRGFVTSRNQEDSVQILARNIDPQRSPTFRSGKIGSWRTTFTPEHKQLFKEVTADLLIKLGYEEDNDW